MISATEARSKTKPIDPIDPIDPNAQLNIIENLVLARAKLGLFECYFYGDMSSYTRGSLGIEGYVVGPTQWDKQENEYLTRISWEA